MMTSVHAVESGWGNAVSDIIRVLYLYVAACFSTIATSMGDLEICLTLAYVEGMSLFVTQEISIILLDSS